jgi:hypothetical protein
VPMVKMIVEVGMIVRIGMIASIPISRSKEQRKRNSK